MGNRSSRIRVIPEIRGSIDFFRAAFCVRVEALLHRSGHGVRGILARSPFPHPRIHALANCLGLTRSGLTFQEN
jgi:hypothetical protein